MTCFTFVFLSQVCSEALLKTLELMSKLRQQVKDMVTSFYKMLQVRTSTSLLSDATELTLALCILYTLYKRQCMIVNSIFIHYLQVITESLASHSSSFLTLNKVVEYVVFL